MASAKSCIVFSPLVCTSNFVFKFVKDIIIGFGTETSVYGIQTGDSVMEMNVGVERYDLLKWKSQWRKPKAHFLIFGAWLISPNKSVNMSLLHLQFHYDFVIVIYIYIAKIQYILCSRWYLRSDSYHVLNHRGIPLCIIYILNKESTTDISWRLNSLRSNQSLWTEVLIF